MIIWFISDSSMNTSSVPFDGSVGSTGFEYINAFSPDSVLACSRFTCDLLFMSAKFCSNARSIIGDTIFSYINVPATAPIAAPERTVAAIAPTLAAATDVPKNAREEDTALDIPAPNAPPPILRPKAPPMTSPMVSPISPMRPPPSESSSSSSDLAAEDVDPAPFFESRFDFRLDSLLSSASSVGVGMESKTLSSFESIDKMGGSISSINASTTVSNPFRLTSIKSNTEPKDPPVGTSPSSEIGLIAGTSDGSLSTTSGTPSPSESSTTSGTPSPSMSSSITGSAFAAVPPPPSIFALNSCAFLLSSLASRRRPTPGIAEAAPLAICFAVFNIPPANLLRSVSRGSTILLTTIPLSSNNSCASNSATSLVTASGN